MPDPTTELTFEPASPTPITDGVLFSVTGPVKEGRVEVRDGNGKLHQHSPEFGQKNRTTYDDIQRLTIATTGTPGGGSYKLRVYDRLSDTDYGETAAIAYDADNDAIVDAINDLFPDDDPATVDDNGNISFGEPLAAKFVSVQVSDNSLTGGTNPDVAVSEVSAESSGGVVVAGGPYLWGPVYLPDDASSVADVVATADDPDNNVYEGDSLLADSVVVYDFGDL